MRCSHGFERTVVECPVCDAVSGVREVDEPRNSRTRSVTNEQIAQAVQLVGSAEGAARHLGINEQTIRNRARKSPLVREALDARRHPRFEDLTGKIFGCWFVIEVAPSRPNGTSRWLCRHDCGGEDVLDGTQLRATSRKFCPSCRPGALKAAAAAARAAAGGMKRAG